MRYISWGTGLKVRHRFSNGLLRVYLQEKWFSIIDVNMFVLIAIFAGLALGQDAKPNVVGSCGGMFTGQYGRIASPGFPQGNYKDNLNCQYVIEVDPGHVIAEGTHSALWAYSTPARANAFDFTMFMDLEPEFLGNCYDWVSIYKSGDKTDTPDSFCGNVIIPDDASTGNKLIVEFKSDVSLGGSGFVLAWSALDLKSIPEMFDCDFDGPLGICPGWTQAHEDMFDWNIKRGRTTGSYTGPDADHSTGSHLGRYAYMEAARQQVNDAAILLSPMTKLDRAQQYCMRFWYQNHGVSNAILFVALIRPHGSAKYIFSHKQDYRNGWREGQVTLEGSSDSIQIAFEARRGNSAYSDLALDDITLRTGPCPVPRTTKSPPATMTSTKVSTTMTIPAIPSCDSNMVFQDCVPGCDLTCEQNRNGIKCEHECVSRCACPRDQPIWIGSRCISATTCPTTTTAPPTTKRETGAEWIARHYARLARLVGPERALSLYMRLVSIYNAWMEGQRSQQ